MGATGTVLNIDKPAGMTSFDVVDRVRTVTGVQKVGHAGTLDPFATGVLLILVGRGATKRFEEFLSLRKTYHSVFQFGLVTDTLDITGEVEQETEAAVDREVLEPILEKYTGEILQVPPMYSAKKVDGVRLYQLARQGKEVEREPVRITVEELRLLDISGSTCTLMVRCSRGTYVRALARDIGEEYGTGACVTKLTRTAIGKYQLEDAIALEDLEEVWNSIAS